MDCFNPKPTRFHTKGQQCCQPPQPLPLPLDSYPQEGSEAAVTSGGVFDAMQDLTQAYGELLGNLGDLQTQYKTDIVGAINETYLLALATDARAQNITQILGAPLSITPNALWLGGNTVSGQTSVQVIADPLSNPTLMIGVYDGVSSKYLPPAGWETIVVRINGVDSLKFYQNPATIATPSYASLLNKPLINGNILNSGNNTLEYLGIPTKTDVAAKYSKPATGIPLSDLAQGVRDQMVPVGGMEGYVLTQTVAAVPVWQKLPDFLTSVAVNDTSSISKLGDGTAVSPLRFSLKLSAASNNIATIAADGLFVGKPATSVITSDSQTVAMHGDGSAASPLYADVNISPASGNRLSVTPQGLYVPSAAASAGSVQYDQEQNLTGAEQAQARANINAASVASVTSLNSTVTTIRNELDDTTLTANNAYSLATAANSAASGAQTTADNAADAAANARAVADSAVSELANKVSRRSGSGYNLYGYTGSTDISLAVSHTYLANAIPQYSAQGTLTGATPTQPTELANKKYIDDTIAVVAAGPYLGAFFFGKTTSAFTPPPPTNAQENYFDFTTNDIYEARDDLTGWDFIQRIAAPINGSVVGITSQFWDLPLDAGKSGTARWNSSRTAWDYYPVAVNAPDGNTITYNTSQQLEVKISDDPDNIISVKADGLFASADSTGLPEAPSVQNNYVLVTDSTGVSSWSNAPLAAMNTAIGTAQTTANNAATAAATAQTDATQALTNAAAAQTAADAAQTAADTAQDTADANTASVTGINTALGNKVDKRTTAGTWLYSHTAATQGEVQYSTAATVNTIAYRDADSALHANMPAAPTSTTLINWAYWDANVATTTADAISDVQEIAESAASEAATAVSTANAATSTAGNAQTTADTAITNAASALSAAQAAQGTANDAVTALDSKRDLITAAPNNQLVAYTATDDTQSYTVIDTAAVAETIAQRNAAGQLIAAAPTAPNHLTTMQYVDDAIAAGGGLQPDGTSIVKTSPDDKLAVLLNTATDNLLTATPTGLLVSGNDAVNKIPLATATTPGLMPAGGAPIATKVYKYNDVTLNQLINITLPIVKARMAITWTRVDGGIMQASITFSSLGFTGGTRLAGAISTIYYHNSPSAAAQNQQNAATAVASFQTDGQSLEAIVYGLYYNSGRAGRAVLRLMTTLNEIADIDVVMIGSNTSNRTIIRIDEFNYGT